MKELRTEKTDKKEKNMTLLSEDVLKNVTGGAYAINDPDDVYYEIDPEADNL